MSRCRERHSIALLALIVLALSIGLMMVTSQCRADTWAVATVGSHHFNSGQHCEVNPGLGFEYVPERDYGVIAGFYKNSLCKFSGYTAGMWTPLHAGSLHAGAVMGVVSGYEQAQLSVAGALILKWEQGNFGVNMLGTPRLRADLPGVLGLQVKWRFE